MNLLDLPQECLDNILERLLRSDGCIWLPFNTSELVNPKYRPDLETEWALLLSCQKVRNDSSFSTLVLTNQHYAFNRFEP